MVIMSIVSGALTPQQRFDQAVELEKQLRSVIQSKGPLDNIVWDLHSNIRKNYETIIVEDNQFADVNDVEQALWRFHYKQIEEFRSRIRKGIAGAAISPLAESKSLPQKESVKMLLSSFKSFLSEAIEFYHELIMKLRQRHGFPKEILTTERADLTSGKQGDTDLKQCQFSCHRCLIYLGDLARYKELHRDIDVRNRDWSVAADYYLKAIFLWPASGNPHNQLAVLATYTGDDLLAVYRYFRSLAVDNPFLTARDNLFLLFEKNQKEYHQQSSAKERMIAKITDREKSKEGKLAVKDNKKYSTEETLKPLQIVEMKKSFCLEFIRLNGILFTKTSLETFHEVYASTMWELENLLSLDDTSLEEGLGTGSHQIRGGTGNNTAIRVVQLVCILIFTVHNIICSNGLQSKYDISQVCTLLQHALTSAFDCAGHFMQRCVESKDVLTSPLLSAILVFMEWLACTPEIVEISNMNENQANAKEFFWRQSVMLLNKLQEVGSGHSEVNRCLDASIGLNADDGIDTESENGFHIALWEDYELQGFIPLVAAQAQLNYSRSCPIAMEEKELKVRVQRILVAGRAIANVLNGAGKWIAYDELTERFCLAKERLEDKTTELRLSDKKETAEVDVKDHFHVHFESKNGPLPEINEQKRAGPIDGWAPQTGNKNKVTDNFHVHVESKNGPLPEIIEQKQAGLIDGCAPQTENKNKVTGKDIFTYPVDAEEDGEVIVFKPVQKEISVNTPVTRKSSDLYFGSSNNVLMYTHLSDDYTHDTQLISEKPSFLILGINNEQSHTVSAPLEQCYFSGCTYHDLLSDVKIQNNEAVSGPNVSSSQAGNEFSSFAFNTTSSYSDMPNSLDVFSTRTISSVQETEAQWKSLNFKNTDSINYLKDWLSRIASLSSLYRSSSPSSWDLQHDDIPINGSMMENSRPDYGEQKKEDLGTSMLNTEIEALSLGDLSNLSITGPGLRQHVGKNLGLSANFNMEFCPERTNINSQNITPTFLMDSFSTVSFSEEESQGKPYPSAPLLPDNDFSSGHGTVASTQFFDCFGVDQRDDFSAGTKYLNLACSMAHDYVSVRNGPSNNFSSDVTQENVGTCWMGLSSSEPAEISSLPMNSEKYTFHAIPRPACQIPQAVGMEGPLKVDNSVWFDAYNHSSLEPNNQKYHDGELSLHSSECDSWLNASNLAASLEEIGFPSQGIGISQFYQAAEVQNSNLLLLQLSQQLLQEQKETKGFGYDVETPTLQHDSLHSLYRKHPIQSQQKLLFLQQLGEQEWCIPHYTRGPATL